MAADKTNGDNLFAILIAAALVMTSFLVQGRIGLNLADEGYLWYGSWRTSLGQIPIRDFQSYDPGRYYWVALWMKAFGSGIVSLRISVAIFQFFGLTCGMLSLKRVIKSRLLLIIAGFILLLWMYPRHKLFEHSLAMASVYVALLLFERPTLLRHFFSGAFVGFAAFIGRNHGVYSFISYLSIILFIWFKLSRRDLSRRLMVWSAGIVLGYLPMIAMVIFIPGYAKSFWSSITFLFRLGATNLPLPIPWPWRTPFGNADFITTVRHLVVGALFLAMPIYYVISLIDITISDRQKIQERALFVVCTFIGIVYMHYAFSRADINHLAQGIHPFLLSVMSLPSLQLKHERFVGIGIGASLLAVSLFSIGLASPYYSWASQKTGSYVNINIRGDNILVKCDTAKLIETVEKINAEVARSGERLLIAPNWPTFYALLKRKSPLWEIYFLFPESSEEQRNMIAQLKRRNTDWVILGDTALDGRDDLRFKNTHRLVWLFLKREYIRVPCSGLPSGYMLLRRIDEVPEKRVMPQKALNSVSNRSSYSHRLQVFTCLLSS